MDVHIRWAIRRDLPEVLDLDWLGTDLSWCAEDYLEYLRQRNVISMVAEIGERVVGIMVYRLHTDHVELVRLVVDPAYRRQGIGSALLRTVRGKLTAHRRAELRAEVALDVDTCRFLRTLGFRGEPCGDGVLFRAGALEPECAGR